MDLTFRETCLEQVSVSKIEGRCLIIGEVAQSHDGSLGLAHSFIDAIADAGADAVKFQTHIAAEESTPGEPWRVKFSSQDESRYDYWKRMEFSKDQWSELKDHAETRGILFMSTPFSYAAVELLSQIGMKVWKVASGEVGNLPMLTKIAAFGDPVILSSGMSGWAELDTAVETVRAGTDAVAILQCTSSYPCPPAKVGLNVMAQLRERYNVPTGLSDHTGNIYAGLAAVALGAEILEVHVALSRKMFGPDVPASLTPDELQSLVEGTREIETMISAPVDKDSAAAELAELRNIFTKSIVAISAIPAGTTLTEQHVGFKKPGTGIPAARLPEVLGRRLNRSLAANEMLTLHDLDLRN